MRLGPIGIWTYHLNYQASERVRTLALEVEDLGYTAIWIGEAVYREPLTAAGVLLAATQDLVVATGVASIWSRDAAVMAAAQMTLAEAYPDRFLLGVGVSHRRLVEPRGHDYRAPLTAMGRYLDGMDEAAAAYRAVRPAAAPRVLGALGPRMLGLAAARSDGAHTYLVPPEHTRAAREILGADRLLVAEQAVVLDRNPVEARRIGRRHVERYLDLPNYTRNLRGLGFTDSDLAPPGSDRLVDALVAWGDEERIAARVRAHLKAGADQVAIQAFVADPHGLPLDTWRRLGPALVESGSA